MNDEKVIVILGKEKRPEFGSVAKIDCSIKEDSIQLKIDSPVKVNLEVSPKDVLNIAKEIGNLMKGDKQ